jgi:hypothetical protein
MISIDFSNPRQVHPFAELFPLLEGAEFDDLVADVRAHGVREPVWLHEGKILDGRNRFRAAEAAGVECPARSYDGDDPVAFVISLNLKRRHLSESQRAMVAAKLATLPHGANQWRSGQLAGPPAQDEAAVLNVGERSVRRAKIVRDSGEPELIALVEVGEISVAAAVERIRRGIVTGVAMNAYVERGLDLYETPAPAPRALLEVESFDGTIWEPACGPGAIVRVLRAAGHHVIATDLVDYKCPNALGGVDFI